MNPVRMSSPGRSPGELLRTALGLYRLGIVPFVALSILSWLGSTAARLPGGLGRGRRGGNSRRRLCSRQHGGTERLRHL